MLPNVATKCAINSAFDSTLESAFDSTLNSAFDSAFNSEFGDFNGVLNIVLYASFFARF
jgi:hypothetical protein